MRRDVLLPELGLGELPIRVCRWFCEPGEVVIEGDRLVQVVAGSVSVDLPSPLSGIFRRAVAELDEPLLTGQRLAVIEAEAEE